MTGTLLRAPCLWQRYCEASHCSAAGFSALSGIKGPTGMYW